MDTQWIPAYIWIKLHHYNSRIRIVHFGNSIPGTISRAEHWMPQQKRAKALALNSLFHRPAWTSFLALSSHLPDLGSNEYVFSFQEPIYLFPWGRLALLGGCWLGKEFFIPERSPLSASWIWNLFNEEKYPLTVSQWDTCKMIFMLERFICQIWKQTFLPQMMLTLPRKLKIL